jgi:hypothetical protein
MPLETATHISDLVTTNPAHSDQLSQADSHMRLLKSVLKTDFPGITGPVTATQAQLNQLASGSVGFADGTSGSPSVFFNAETGNGFYRPGTGQMKATKRLLGNGTIPVGSLHSFPKDPGSSLLARGATATGTEEYIELDGSVYNISTFPDLGAFYGSTFGGNGTTTFGVPNWKDTGRFPRHRTNSVVVGTSQSNQNLAHNHTASSSSSSSISGIITTTTAGFHNHGGSTGTHSHGLSNIPGSGSTSLQSFTVGPTSYCIGTNGGGVTQTDNATASISSDGDHSHTVNLASGGVSTSTSTTVNSSGGTEARPEAFVVIFCAKT